MTTYPVNVIETEKANIRSWDLTRFEGYLLVPVRQRIVSEWIAYNEVFAERLYARMLTSEGRNNVRYDLSLLSKSVAELFEVTTPLAHSTPLHEGD
jgi:hypothetical protein